MLSQAFELRLPLIHWAFHQWNDGFEWHITTTLLTLLGLWYKIFTGFANIVSIISHF
jgi:hypothetical protein